MTKSCFNCIFCKARIPLSKNGAAEVDTIPGTRRKRVPDIFRRRLQYSMATIVCANGIWRKDNGDEVVLRPPVLPSRSNYYVRFREAERCQMFQAS